MKNFTWFSSPRETGGTTVKYLFTVPSHLSLAFLRRAIILETGSMILETLIAATAYSGALTYLHNDAAAQSAAVPVTNVAVTTPHTSYNERAGLKSFRMTPTGQVEYTDAPSDPKNSIFAKSEGKFEDWAK